MKMNTFVKDPSAVLDYAADWSAWLASVGDTITASTWTPDTGITVGTGGFAPSFTPTKTTVWLSGGTAGVSYKIVNHITTVAGRQNDVTIAVICQET